MQAAASLPMMTNVARALAFAALLMTGAAPAELQPVASPSPRESFQDCTDCPRMVVIPGGEFLMGSPPEESGRRQNEGPQRRLAIASFAMSETEITQGQYAAFVQETNRAAEGGCYTHGDGSDDISDVDPRASWRSPGFESTPEHPVVCVSWHEARDYAAWLSRKTGETYRLPSEAEWEYAARAGTTSAFFWGDSADRECVRMNGGDRSLVRALPAWSQSIATALRNGDPRARLVECDDGSPFTSVVGRYQPNPFGLRDIIGNAWEWVEDCWSESLPMESRPKVALSCDHRTRGGSWDDFPEDLRSARRGRLAPDQRRNDVGFRLARTLRGAARPTEQRPRTTISP